jgi:transposase InsO family protein
MADKDRTPPKLAHKLIGQHNFAAWALAIQQCLDNYDLGTTDYTIWDVVEGTVPIPEKTEDSKGKATYDIISNREWRKANNFALLVMKKNCEDEPLAKFELEKNASDAYIVLKSHYEGKTVTDIGAVLANVIKYTYDDRAMTIEEHITEYERRWNFMKATLSNSDFPDKAKEFGKHLKGLSETEAAKTEFLLLSLPSFYSATVENLRTNAGYSYGNIINQLKLYIPARQRGNKGGKKKEDGNSSESTILKTGRNERDKTKQCNYCKGKGWRGIGHTDEECFTKKREMASEKEIKKANNSDDENSEAYIYNTASNENESISTTQLNRFEWDTGASDHTTNRLDIMTDVQDVETRVRGHDGSVTISPKRGTIRFKHQGRSITLTNVLYHPMYSNLISASQHPGYTPVAEENKPATISIKGKVIYNITIDKGKLWIIPDNEGKISVINSDQDVKELHERYGHLSFNAIYSLPEMKNVKRNMIYCEACEQGKSTKPAARNHGQKGVRTTKILQRIHADLIGPIIPESRGYKYLLTIADEYSRYNMAIPLKKKNEAGSKLLEAISTLERVTDESVQEVQADWGKEFQRNEFQGELRQRGIIAKETVPYHSETNALIERVNRSIMAIARTATIGAKMPKNTWSDATQWATYTKNRMPYKTTGKAPIELLLKRDPAAERKNLRKYGEWVWVHDYTATGKLEPRAVKARIINYTNTYNVYWTIDAHGKRRLSKALRPAQSEENEVEGYLPVGESNIPENTYPSENNSEDPAAENPAQPTEKTSIEILHERIPEHPTRITEPVNIKIPYESTQSPVLPAVPKKRHYKTAEDWAQLVWKREGGRSFSRSRS